MRVLSATEAINPAIERTKALLFQPFLKGRTWKLAATAYFARMGTIFIPLPLVYLFILPLAAKTGAVGVIVLIGAVVFLTLFGTWLFHLCSRLQFAYFDIVLHRGQFVAPAWRKYASQSLPWTTLKIVIGTAATLIAALPIAATIWHLLPLLQDMQSQRAAVGPPAQFFFALFAIYGLIFLIFGPVYLFTSLLCDFMMPTLALEDTGLAEAFQRFITLVRSEPGQFGLFTLLKIGLGLAAYGGMTIAVEIVFFIVTLVLVLIAGLIGWLLHLIGIPTAILTGLAICFAFAWYIAVLGYGIILANGIAITFLDAYALYFLGGRYQILGDILEPPPPPTFAAAPPPPPFAPA
jgi:hypothetical protein